ncbi:unnamed protein product [Brachionus calyciflorus]|uniref:Uncharacterized protein n=1 Tax=Brachionus calyciflorus TaxID=104777 RepID=A0A813QS58_9BILA|nr:unnamed protein product [Brachionus calyciflorus]
MKMKPKAMKKEIMKMNLTYISMAEIQTRRNSNQAKKKSISNSNKKSTNKRRSGNEEFLAEQKRLCSMNYSADELITMAKKNIFPTRVFRFNQKF